MSLHANLERFYNLRVKDFQATGDIRNFSKVAPRVRCREGNPATLADHLGTLLAEPSVGAIRALVLGMWGEKWGASTPPLRRQSNSLSLIRISCPMWKPSSWATSFPKKMKSPGFRMATCRRSGRRFPICANSELGAAMGFG